MGHLHSFTKLKTKCPRWESNPGLDLRRVACKIHHTPRTISFSTPPRNRTPSDRFEVCHAVHHTRRALVLQYPDLGSNQGLDLRRVQCFPLHHRDMYFFQRPNLESNQDQDLRKVLCCPLHHRDVFKQEPTTGFAPASTGLQDRRLSQSSHVGNQARARGVEPRPPVLEAGCSPRSTLV
jgi:hypothetical protein